MGRVPEHCTASSTTLHVPSRYSVVCPGDHTRPLLFLDTRLFQFGAGVSQATTHIPARALRLHGRGPGAGHSNDRRGGPGPPRPPFARSRVWCVWGAVNTGRREAQTLKPLGDVKHGEADYGAQARAEAAGGWEGRARAPGAEWAPAPGLGFLPNCGGLCQTGPGRAGPLTLQTALGAHGARGQLPQATGAAEQGSF